METVFHLSEVVRDAAVVKKPVTVTTVAVEPTSRSNEALLPSKVLLGRIVELLGSDGVGEEVVVCVLDSEVEVVVSGSMEGSDVELLVDLNGGRWLIVVLVDEDEEDGDDGIVSDSVMIDPHPVPFHTHTTVRLTMLVTVTTGYVMHR